MDSEFHIVFECVSGSRLYGIATPDSDTDIRGVFIPSSEYFLGFTNKVEQIEESGDRVYYEIRKFFHLCAACNPNIVELLFAPPTVNTVVWDRIVENRYLFLSKLAAKTFNGYAVSQLKRIETHRRWLLNPVTLKPTRESFGLPERSSLISKEELGVIDSVDSNVKLSSEVMAVYQREKAYQNALRDWQNYQQWKCERNKKRAVLEQEFGYDTKHASHLIRLLSEGTELLREEKLTFPRPDRDLLLDIRKGKYDYRQLMEITEEKQAEMESSISFSRLPDKPNMKSLDKLCVSLVEANI